MYRYHGLIPQDRLAASRIHHILDPVAAKQTPEAIGDYYIEDYFIRH